MSRVGNSPILIPEGVNVQINPKDVIISGKLGSLAQTYDTISVEKKENQLLPFGAGMGFATLSLIFFL